MSPLKLPLRGRLACAVTFLLAAVSVTAQDTVNSTTNHRLLACDAVVDSGERLACFNSVVESLKSPAEIQPATAPSAAADAEGETPEVPTPAAPARPTVGAAPSAPEPASAVSEPVSPARQADAPAATGGAPSLSEAVFAGAPSAPPVDEEAADEETSGEKGDEPAIDAVIVKVWQQLDGRFTVRLDNGQVWRETQGTRVGMPDVGAAVTIRRGPFGSYRMKIEGISRVAWVRPPK